MKMHVKSFFLMWKTATAVLALNLWFVASTCVARPIQMWTFSELVEEADVVVIGTVEALEDAPGGELDPNKTDIPVRCRIRVDAVTKGEVSGDVLTIRLFRLMTNGEYLDARGEEGEETVFDSILRADRNRPVPVINGPRYAYDSLRDALNEQEQEEDEQPFRRERRQFLLFLKAGADGDYEPVTEWTDSVDSVFRLDKADP